MLNKQRLLTPGPTPMPERVRLAMARDMIHHRKPEFKALMHELREGLGEIFGTAQPVLPLTASGTGAMVAAVSNLFAPGEKTLVIDGGKFAERWLEICSACGVIAVPLKVEWGQGVNPADVAAALNADPEIRGVLMQHSETSTGVQHNVRAVAALVRESPALLVVDGISAVSITPCPMDAWGIDCLLTGSQKGLMLPPGLALVALSARAWEKVEARRESKIRNFYFDLLGERKNNSKGETCFTPAISLLTGLAESLRMFRECGLKELYRKQWALAMMARKGVKALGLNLYAEKDFAWGVTSVLLPRGIDSGPLLASAAGKFGVVMAAGQGHMKKSIVRIGHMGWIDYADLAAGLYAFAEAYKDCGGFLGCRDYLEQALYAYREAFAAGPPDEN